VIRAPAKINLFLEILSKRADGYHEIVTFLTAVDLFDVLKFRRSADGEIRLTCDDKTLPTGAENLICRAATLLRDWRTESRSLSGPGRGVHIHLQKRIPVGAGLGGGSSDAAATLVALNRIWKLGLGTAELTEIAADLGSDVPFFLRAHRAIRVSKTKRRGAEMSGAAWCTGRGEQVSLATLKRPLHCVVTCPAVALSTAKVYQGVKVPRTPRSPVGMEAALTVGSVPAIGAELFNRLQPVAERLCPEVAALRRVMEKLAPPGHVMSGSGSAYVALCRSRADARTLARQVPRLFHSPGTGPREGRGLRLFVLRTQG
jgi:4-diphosphocytidyl-2-C-methyl-D-erythritol kinase